MPMPSSQTLCAIAAVFTCFVCNSHGHRGRMGGEEMPASPCVGLWDPLNSTAPTSLCSSADLKEQQPAGQLRLVRLRKLLLMLVAFHDPAAGWQFAGHRRALPNKNPVHAYARLSSEVSMKLAQHGFRVLSRRSAFASALVATAQLLHTDPALAAVELSEEQSLIVDAWAVVQRAYVDTTFNGLDWQAVRSKYIKRPYRSMKEARDATAEMLSSLGDRYTRYVTPGSYKALIARFEAPRGTDGGIGVTLGSSRTNSNGLEVVAVVEGSPASAAGLRVGDTILSVEGRKFESGSTADDVAALILGPLDQNVRLEFAHPGDSQAVQASLQRAPLRFGEVASKIVTSASGKKVGVVTIPEFSEGSRWFSSLTDSLQKVQQADQLLLDLRGNAGGHFPTGVEAAKLFLPRNSLIVSSKDRMGKLDPYETISDGIWASRAASLYVLVDRGTASAAEVFTAALKENNAATIIGEDTFGKGLVQTIAKVSDGGAVICTTAKYVTPKGNDINGVGIVPDLSRTCPAAKPAIDCL